MYAFEFRTKIKDGMIEVPKEYRERLRREISDEQVRVILLTLEQTETNQVDTGEDLIDQLLTNPLYVPDFIPLSRDKAHERS